MTGNSASCHCAPYPTVSVFRDFIVNRQHFSIHPHLYTLLFSQGCSAPFSSYSASWFPKCDFCILSRPQLTLWSPCSALLYHPQLPGPTTRLQYLLPLVWNCTGADRYLRAWKWRVVFLLMRWSVGPSLNWSHLPQSLSYELEMLMWHLQYYEHHVTTVAELPDIWSRFNERVLQVCRV